MPEAAHPNVPIPAATLIAFRNGAPDPEILMIRRSRALTFGAGAAVFPGGRIDPGDHDIAADMPGDAEWNVARVAAVRETLEEIGLLTGVAGDVTADSAAQARAALLQGTPFGSILKEFGWSINVDALIPFARWLPPAEVARAFDTFFLLADLGTGSVTLSADGTETTGHFWTTACDMLERGERDEEALLFPTRMNLIRLSRAADFTAAEADACAFPLDPIRTILEEHDGEMWIRVPPDRGYPDAAEPTSRARRHG